MEHAHDVTDRCCNAPYASIGTIGRIGPDWTSDQFGLPGSHLPLKLEDIEALEGAWTFQVPTPVAKSDTYPVH